MAATREVKTQAELDQALADAVTAMCVGDGYFAVSDSVTVHAYDSVTVHASAYVAVHKHGSPSVMGGVIIDVPAPSTPLDWCEYRGVEIIDVDGKPAAVLAKAVRGDYRSARPAPDGTYVYYTPGSMPTAPDWDGGERECGGGLHFCARPWESAAFLNGERDIRYVACPVWLEDIAVHADANMPQKVKARGVCAPCWEIDANGDRIAPTATSP